MSILIKLIVTATKTQVVKTTDTEKNFFGAYRNKTLKARLDPIKVDTFLEGKKIAQAYFPDQPMNWVGDEAVCVYADLTSGGITYSFSIMPEPMRDAGDLPALTDLKFE